MKQSKTTQVPRLIHHSDTVLPAYFAYLPAGALAIAKMPSGIGNGLRCDKC